MTNSADPDQLASSEERRVREEYMMIILGKFFLFLHKNVCYGYSLEATGICWGYS